MPTTDGTWRAGRSRDAAGRWPVVEALVASTCFFLALALFLAVRRVMGALVEPLSAGNLVAAAVLTLAWAWSVRAIGSRLWADDPLLSGKPARWLVAWMPLVAMLLVAVACSYPGDRWIDWGVWLPAVAAAWFAPGMSSVSFKRLAASPRSAGLGASGERSSPAIAADESQGELLQQLTRVRLAEGREAVHGVLVAEFAAGQDLATLYVGFCPPFEELPHVETEVADGPAANIKIVQVLHNGARLDVGLARPAAAATRVSVEFLAAERGELLP